MKLSVFAVALAILQAVAAHTVFTTLFVNDVDQGDGTCVRMPMTPSNTTFPVNDLESSAMACGMFEEDWNPRDLSRILNTSQDMMVLLASPESALPIEHLN
jgi:hypothetical protein